VTQRLSVACARHPWRTVAAWIGAILVAVVLVGALLGDNLTSEGNVTNDPESLRAIDLQSDRFPQQEGFDELVIVRSDRLRVDEEPFREKVTQLATAVRATGATESVRTYDTNSGDRSLVSPDSRATLIPISLVEPGEDHIEEVLGVVEDIVKEPRRDPAEMRPFTAVLEGGTPISTPESLRFTEVLRRTGKEGDLQAFANRAASARAVPTVRRRYSVVLCQTTKIPALRGFPFSRALSRTRTGDRLLTMNVRRGSIHAGFRVVARVRRCREYPRFVPFCMAVRPWCDLAATATAGMASASLAGSYRRRSVCRGSDFRVEVGQQRSAGVDDELGLVPPEEILIRVGEARVVADWCERVQHRACSIQDLHDVL
jgi:hypothetical protein